MTKNDVIEYVENDLHQKKETRNMLLTAYSVGEELPEGYDNWEVVDFHIRNLDIVIEQVEASIEGLRMMD